MWPIARVDVVNVSKRQKCFLCARMWPRPEREFTCHILNQWIQMGDVLERHDT